MLNIYNITISVLYLSFSKKISRYMKTAINVQSNNVATGRLKLFPNGNQQGAATHHFSSMATKRVN